MMDKIVHTDRGVTILGAGAVSPPVLAAALRLAPVLVAADGGADTALAEGLQPAAVIGDMDSLGGDARARFAGRLHSVAEQDSTDFEKTLLRIEAPFVLGLGLTGSRLDHGLAALNLIAREPTRRVFLLSGEDVVFLAPPRLDLALPVGTRLSLFPLAPVAGRSKGLVWPIDGIEFSPLGRIGVSNRSNAARVCLEFDAPHMLLILPRDALAAALAAFDLPL